jgi:hypothetical protein
MAMWIRHEIVTRRVEYSVPSGLAVGEFNKAWNAARHDYCRRNGINPENGRVYDDWAHVEARDDEITIVFAVDEPVPADLSAELTRLRVLVGEEGQPGWDGVSRAEAIKQVNEKRASAMEWMREHDARRNERDEARKAIRQAREVLDEAENATDTNAELALIGKIRRALACEMTP